MEPGCHKCCASDSPGKTDLDLCNLDRTTLHHVNLKLNRVEGRDYKTIGED